MTFRNNCFVFYTLLLLPVLVFGKWNDNEISKLRTGVRSHQVSSYDRTGGNNDKVESQAGIQSYLYEKDGEYILLDEMGSGCVTRFWFTKVPFANLNVYLDGKKTPDISVDLYDFFSGNFVQFPFPLNADEVYSSGGYYSYIPIYFEHSIKISTSSIPYYYHIGYEKYLSPQPTRIPSIAQVAEWSNDIINLELPFPVPQDTSRTLIHFDVNSGSHASFDIPNGGVLQEIVFKIETTELNLDWLKDIWIDINFDHKSEAQVYSPLDLFFAGAVDTIQACSSLPVITRPDEKLFIMRFPMPFENNATLTLHNKSASVQQFKAKCELLVEHSVPLDFNTDYGYFCASYSDKAAPSGQDYQLLQKEGTGHVVGTVIDMSGNSVPYNLEGDERVYIDGSRTPQIYGTGTEDFFNGGWYFKFGCFSTPFHGLVRGPAYVSNKLVAYRYFLSDPIVFNNSIKYGIEHGPQNDVSTDYRSLVLWYGKELKTLWLSDSLWVADANNQAEHNMVLQNSSSVSKTACFEGDEDNHNLSMNGLWVRDEIQFDVDIDPENNGVLLFRVLDYAVAHQRLNVYVDDVFAGVWQTSGQNTNQSWREDEFLIAPQYTVGKSEIHLTLKALDEQHPFTLYDLKVLSFSQGSLPVFELNSSIAPLFLIEHESETLEATISNTGENTLYIVPSVEDENVTPTVLVTGWGEETLPFHDNFLDPWRDHGFDIVFFPDVPASIQNYDHVVFMGHSNSNSSIHPDSLDAFVDHGGVAFVFGSACSNNVVPIQAHSSAVLEMNGRDYHVGVSNTRSHEITLELPERLSFRGWAENASAAAGTETLLCWENGLPYFLLKSFGSGYMLYCSHENAWNSATWYGDQSAGLQLCENVLNWLSDQQNSDWFSFSNESLAINPGCVENFNVQINPNNELIQPGRNTETIFLRSNDPNAPLHRLELLCHFGLSKRIELASGNQQTFTFLEADLSVNYSALQNTELLIKYFPIVNTPFVAANMLTRLWQISCDLEFVYKPVLKFFQTDVDQLGADCSQLVLKAFVDKEWVNIPTVVDSLNFTLQSLIELSGTQQIGIGLNDSGKTLPVELTQFTAHIISGDSIKVKWRTESESSNWGFELQRSINHSGFMKIAFLPGKGTTQQRNEYLFVDYAPEHAVISYRLKQIDFDGSYCFSSVARVEALQAFSLNANYPNPFNAVTTIEYDLLRDCHIKLNIYDLQGRLVKTLVNDMQQAGHHQLLWRAKNNNDRNIASGVYFLKFEYPTGGKVQKLTLVR